jgi:hypothetical protein
MDIHRRDFLLALAAVAAPVGSRAATSGWRVGLASADITPRAGVWMAGYAARKEAAQGTAQPLHVKAAAFEDDANVYVRRHARLMLEVISRKGRTPAFEQAPLHVLRIGSFCLVAIGGEAVVDYALAIKQKQGEATTSRRR